MPRIDDDTVFAKPFSVVPEDRSGEVVEGPGTLETLRAAGRLQNSMGQLQSIAERLSFDAEPVEGYNPYTDIAGYEEFAEDFDGSRSPQQTEMIKRHIDEERGARETIEQAGWFGMLAEMAAGVIDPVNLIPVGGAAARGGSIARAAGRAALVGGATEVAFEAGMQQSQHTRTLDESVLNVLGTTVLSGVLGGAAAGLSKRALAKARRGVDDMVAGEGRLAGGSGELDTRLRRDEVLDPTQPVRVDEGPSARGKGQTALKESDFGRIRKGATDVLEKLSPKLRTLRSDSKVARAATQQLVDTAGLFVEQNADAIATGAVRVRMLDPTPEVGMAGRVVYRPLDLADQAGEALAQGRVANRRPPKLSTEAADAADAPARPIVESLAERRTKLGDPGIAEGEVVEVLRQRRDTGDLVVRTQDGREVTVPNADVEDAPGDLVRRKPAEGETFASEDVGRPVVELDPDNPVSVEGMVADLANRRLRPFVEARSEAWGKYLKRTGTSKASAALRQRGDVPDIARLNETEFNEFSGRAARYLDAEPGTPEATLFDRVSQDVPEAIEAAQAWKRTMADPFLEDLQELGLVGELKNTTAPSYLTRVYDQDLIQTNRAMFKAKLVSNSLRTNPALTRGKAEATADDTINKLLHTPIERTHYGPASFKDADAIHQRMLDIPDREIEDFLVSDIEIIADRYFRTVAPDVALTRKFGDPSMSVQFEALRRDYDNMIAQAEQTLEGQELVTTSVELQKALERDVKNLEHMRDQIRGTDGYYGLDYTAWKHTLRDLRQFNTVRMMGGVAVASFPDVGRPVMAHGMRRTLGTSAKLLGKMAQGKLSKKHIRRLGVALERTLHSRSSALFDTTPSAKSMLRARHYNPNSRLPKPIRDMTLGARMYANNASRTLTNKFSKLTFFDFYNDTIQSWAGHIATDDLVKRLGKVASGKASAKDMEILASFRIDKDMADRMSAMIAKYGTDPDGLGVPQTDLWVEDPQAALSFADAIRSDVEHVIVTPGAGDTPKLMSVGEMRSILQFKTFLLSVGSRMIVPALQNPNPANTLAGIGVMVGMGAAVANFSKMLKGEEIITDPQTLILEGIDRSGILGIFMEGSNIADRSAGVGLRGLTGTAPPSRYASRNVLDSLTGPTIGTLQTAINAVDFLGPGRDISESNVKAMRRLVPLQNVWWMRRGIEEVEDSLVENVVGKR